MKRLRSLMGPGFWTGIAMVMGSAACGQPFSSATGGAGGTGSAGPGASTSGSGSGGAVASTGSGGAAKCTASSCPAGAYCDSSASTCAPCADLTTRFQFGPPVATHVTVPAMGASVLYPRPNQDTGALFVVQQDAPTAGYQDQLALAPAPSTPGEAAWTDATLLSQFAGLYQDSGPLYLSAPSLLSGIVDDSVAMSTSPVLLFDSNRTANKREVFAAILGASAAPAPLLLPGGAVHASRVAISLAASPPQFWWISDAGTVAERLVTGTVTATTPAEVQITLDDGCPSPLADTPWVTPKGERLLFASQQTGASPGCATVPTVTHLYQVSLSVDGMATGKAEPIFAGDTNLDTTPALTTDLCALLFARFDSAGNGEIYEAPRD